MRTPATQARLCCAPVCAKNNQQALCTANVTLSGGCGQRDKAACGKIRKTMAHDLEKEVAAQASIRFIRDGDIVGLGSGSTAAHVVRLLGERVRAGLAIRGIPTSNQTRELAAGLGIPLTTFDEVQEIDVTIDGADEVDAKLSLIKGGGGALLHEKVVASASRKLVIIVDSSKQVPVLGKFPVPIEVIAFAQPLVKRKIEMLGASVEVRHQNDTPFVTDEGHHILDCSFGQIPDAPALARTLSDMPGIVEHGLFIGMATVVLIAHEAQVTELHPVT
jgi:ribose 5-phosphate isomerase A